MKNRAPTHLETESSQLEHKLKSENSSEDHVHDVQGFGVQIGLLMKFHSQRYSVDEDEDKDDVLKWL